MALKKIMIRRDDKVYADMIRTEVKIWKELGKHPNIVELYDYSTVEEDGAKFVIVLMEICEDGHLLDLLERHDGKISEKGIIAIMQQITKGICYMHSQSPPVAHRDIKIENIILKGKEFKLCDFGSASINSLFHNTADSREIEMQFEHYERFTTMMYRPPEMID